MQNPKWETDEEFDDGGTPKWRARQAHLQQQARHTITISAPPSAPRTLREWWDSLTVAQCALIGYFVPMFLMASLVVGGVIFILALDWLERHGIIHPQ